MIAPWALIAGLAAAPSTDLPLARAARPLVLPEGRYQVDFGGRYAPIADDTPLFRLDLGGTVGIVYGLQVRIDLLRWNFSRQSGYGLEQPRLALAYGLLRGGVVELALEVGAEVPSAGDLAGDASLALRGHGGRWLRWDLVAGVSGSGSDIRPESSGFGRGQVVLTPIAPLSLVGGAEAQLVTLTGAETLAGRAFGELSWSFPTDEGEVRWELGAELSTPLERLEGGDLDAPRFGFGWSGGLNVRLFFDEPASTVDDPWDDDFLR